MRDADHDRHAAVDTRDGAADQRLALFEAQISIFLRLHAGRHHHRSAAVVDDVVDLAFERALLDREVGREWRQRRDDQSRFFCWHFHKALLAATGDATQRA